MDTCEKVVTASLSGTAVLFTIFYKLYKNRNRTADEIKHTEVFSLDDDLVGKLRSKEGGLIAYATVEGLVEPEHQTLHSRHSALTGVIHHRQVVEHKSKRIQGFWSDAERLISNTVEGVPFVLTHPDKPEQKVHVTDALNAEFILDDLTVTYDQFNPEKSSLLQHGIERAFGEYTKGFQEKEKMLLVGTSLVGIGEIYLENNQVKLGPPSEGSYILSRLSRNEIIRRFESQSFIYKVLSIIFGAVSAGLTIYLIWKFTKKYLEHKRNRRIFEEIRAATRSTFEDNHNGDERNMCIICLSQPRDVVLLDCGHVCICSHCAEILPSPKCCPVCRAAVQRFVPLYRS